MLRRILLAALMAGSLLVGVAAPVQAVAVTSGKVPVATHSFYSLTTPEAPPLVMKEYRSKLVNCDSVVWSYCMHDLNNYGGAIYFLNDDDGAPLDTCYNLHTNSPFGNLANSATNKLKYGSSNIAVSVYASATCSGSFGFGTMPWFTSVPNFNQWPNASNPVGINNASALVLRQ